MEKFMNLLKENFYFVIGVFIIFILVIVLVIACSFGNESSYVKLENKLVESAKKYYEENQKKLPKDEDETVSVSLSFLVKNDYIKEIKDPKTKKTCSGKVEVTKRNKKYNYQAFLDCGKNYKTEFLSDALKESLSLDDTGNGLYKINEEFVFKGDRVNNYVSFNDELWQVIKIDNEGDIKLIKLIPTDDFYIWDNRYNVSVDNNFGVNDFPKSRIRYSLEAYYKNNFNETEGVKEKILKKDFCVGKRKQTDPINTNVECSNKMSMYVGLITASEFHMASLDSKCTKFLQKQCSNYNYLARNANTWSLTASAEDSSKVYRFSSSMYTGLAIAESKIAPVIYVDSRTISRGGDGTETNPFIIK